MESFPLCPFSLQPRSRSPSPPPSHGTSNRSGIQLIKNITHDLHFSKTQLANMKSDNGHSEQHLPSSMEPSILSSISKDSPSKILQQRPSSQKPFQKTIEKPRVSEYRYDIKVSTVTKQSQPALLPTPIDPFIQNSEMESLRRNYNKLFNESMQLRRNRVEWKEYDRVRTENGDLRNKIIELNEELIRQRSQVGNSRRDVENMKNVDLKRLEGENSYLKEEIRKVKEGGQQAVLDRIAEFERQSKRDKEMVEKLQKERDFEKQQTLAAKPNLELEEKMSQVRNSNASLQAEIGRQRSKQKDFQKELDELKGQIATLESQLTQAEREKKGLSLLNSELRNQNQNLALQRQSAEATDDLSKLRADKKEVIYQLQQKLKEINSLKHQIMDNAAVYTVRQEKDSLNFKQKINILQKQLADAKRGDKVSIGQLDDIFRSQTAQNQKIRESLETRSHEIYSAQQQLTTLRSSAENAKSELEVQRVKHLVQKKNLSSQWEAERDNLLGQQNIERKRIQSLEGKVKHADQQNRKKDEFVKRHLLGKSDSLDLKELIEGFFQQYKGTFD